MQIRYAAVSDAGRKRSRNEDAFLTLIPRESWLNGFFVVADGMGGHEAGDVASQTTVARLQSYILEQRTEPTERSGRALLDGLEEELRQTSSQLREMSAARKQVRGMGSTATAAAFADLQIYIAHVGDTRIYRYREGRLRQLTLDHSWVAEQQRRGWISAEQAADHPQKNILTQALGTPGDLDVYKKSFPVRSKDRYLICSDGLYGAATVEQIQSILDEVPDPEKAAQQLVDSANAAGGPDNITAIVCDALFTEEDEAAAPLPEPEDDGSELPVPLPTLAEARPDEDPAARQARLAELKALDESEMASGSGPESETKADRSVKRKWFVVGIALVLIAVAVALLR